MNTPPDSAQTFDAGFMGCGELVMLLHQRLKSAPGQIVRVIARDAGAAEDLPAWCRMTRNELLHHDADSQSFWIRARNA